MKLCTALGSSVLLGAAAIAVGQGYYGGYVDNRASTPGESYARGMSDLVRSAGAANLMNSQAASNYEDARSKNFDNRIKYTDTYFEMRRMNREYRAAERGPRVSTEALFRFARDGVPQRMGPSELDPLSGKINWPSVLMQSDYAAERAKLEQLFAQRANTHGFSSASQFTEVKAATDALLTALKENIGAYPSNVYLSAKKFVERLDYESRFPVT